MQFLVNDDIRLVDSNNKVLIVDKGQGKVITVSDQQIVVKWWLPVILEKRPEPLIVEKVYSIDEINKLSVQKRHLKYNFIWTDKNNNCYDYQGNKVENPEDIKKREKNELINKQKEIEVHMSITDPVPEK